MSVLPACCVYVPCACLVLTVPELSVTDGCEFLDVDAESNLCPERAASERSRTVEPSLQLQVGYLKERK